jgi:hypothetical protein
MAIERSIHAEATSGRAKGTESGERDRVKCNTITPALTQLEQKPSLRLGGLRPVHISSDARGVSAALLGVGAARGGAGEGALGVNTAKAGVVSGLVSRDVVVLHLVGLLVYGHVVRHDGG